MKQESYNPKPRFSMKRLMKRANILKRCVKPQSTTTSAALKPHSNKALPPRAPPVHANTIFPSDNGLFDMLPREMIVKIFSHLGTAQDVSSCSTVSRFFADAANESTLWQEMATLKFGTTVVNNTSSLYGGNWKSMLEDDNRRGALPSQLLSKPCHWKYVRNWDHQLTVLDRREYSFYCCFITGLQWDRPSHQLRVYIDVRGERDLPHPLKSTMCVAHGSVVHISPALWRGQHTDGHFKGYLSFDERHFQNDGIYCFEYASKAGEPHTFEWTAVLPKKLQSTSFVHYTTLDVNLFDNETREDEKDRWRGVVPVWFWQCRPR